MFEKRVVFKEENSDLSDILIVLTKVLFIFFIVSIFLFFLWFSKNENSFTLKKFNVYGIVNSNKNNVYSLLEKYRGKNLLRLNLKEIANKLEKMNWYKNVELSVALPDSLDITLQERKPFAIALIGSKLFVIDREGDVIMPFTNKYKYLCKMPMVTGLCSWDDDSTLKKKITLFKNFINSIDQSGMGNYLSRISEVNVNNLDDLIIVVNKMEIKLGDDEFVGKLKRFFKYEKEIVSRYGNFLQVDLSTLEDKMKIKRMGENRIVKLENRNDRR